MALKQLFFQKNCKKSRSGWGLRPQTPIASGGWGLRPQTPVNNTFELQYTSLLNTSANFYILTLGFSPPPLNEFLLTCQHQATAFDLPSCDIFASAKNSSFEVSDDVIACDLRFGPPQSKILATPMVPGSLSPLPPSRRPCRTSVPYFFAKIDAYRAVLTYRAVPTAILAYIDPLCAWCNVSTRVLVS